MSFASGVVKGLTLAVVFCVHHLRLCCQKGGHPLRIAGTGGREDIAHFCPPLVLPKYRMACLGTSPEAQLKRNIAVIAGRATDASGHRRTASDAAGMGGTTCHGDMARLKHVITSSIALQGPCISKGHSAALSIYVIGHYFLVIFRASFTLNIGTGIRGRCALK